MYSEMREEASDHARVRNAYFEQVGTFGSYMPLVEQPEILLINECKLLSEGIFQLFYGNIIFPLPWIIIWLWKKNHELHVSWPVSYSKYK